MGTWCDEWKYISKSGNEQLEPHEWEPRNVQ